MKTHTYTCTGQDHAAVGIEAVIACAGIGNSFGVLCHLVVLGGVLFGWTTVVHAGLTQLYFCGLVSKIILGSHASWTFTTSQTACPVCSCMLSNTVPRVSTVKPIIHYQAFQQSRCSVMQHKAASKHSTTNHTFYPCKLFYERCGIRIRAKHSAFS